MNKSLFFKPKDKKLAKIISIETPSGFKASVKKLSVGGISLKEKRALELAQTRAMLQLRRKALSDKERRQMEIISKIKIPKVAK